MTEPNYYTLFGINSDATAEQIRLAFRKAILEHHPDKNGGKSSSQEWTILLKEAYDVLSDPTERSRYDARLKFQQPPPPGQTPPPRERPNPSASTPPPRQPPPSAPPNTGGQQRAQANARQDTGQEAGWQEGDFACQRCKALDETLRICVFRSVVSLLFFTRTALVEPGIYCAPCRLRLGLKWSLQCFVMGWWGFPFGILWTVAALFNNLRGGVQGHSQNASLLECVGAILLHKGDAGTATLALLKSRKLDEHRPEAKRLLAEALQQPHAPRAPHTNWQRINPLISVCDSNRIACHLRIDSLPHRSNERRFQYCALGTIPIHPRHPFPVRRGTCYPCHVVSGLSCYLEHCPCRRA